VIGANLIVGLINLVIGIAEALIGLRVLLKLLGAREAATFVRWVYETTQPLLSPFEGMFPSPVFGGKFILEFSALFGLVIYAIIGFLLVQLIEFIDTGLKRAKIKRE